MAFGLNNTGFNKKTLSDVLDSLNNRVIEEFGAVNTGPDSVFGQYNGIIAEIAGDLWDLADLVYASQYALSAFGVSLDAVAELNNISRLSATSSSVLAILEGTAATVVPLSTQFLQNNTNEVFESNGAVTIENTNMLKCVFSVATPAGAPHTLDIVSATHGTDNFSSSETVEADILSDLAGQINTLGHHSAVATATTLTITNTTTGNTEIFEISTFSASLSQDEIWTPVTLEAVNTGALEVPANSIQTINTPVVGLNQVDNLAAGTQGRDLETDDELRLRRKQSIRVVGAATVPAIEARLVEEIEEVSSAVVKDNRTDVTDSQGRPPHSFEAIVTFSPDTASIRQAIAEKIWGVKPAGIATHGNITELITDSAGDSQAVKFSTPVFKYVHINITITLNDEETFPSTGEDDIKAALAEFGNSLLPGDDVIRQRFFNSVYSVEGVKNIDVFDLAVTENPLDVPILIVMDDIDTEPSPGIYNMLTPGVLVGVVSGMIMQNLAGSLVTSVRAVPTDTQVQADEDLFNPGDTITIGDFGPANIGINAVEQAVFDVTRINITIA